MRNQLSELPAITDRMETNDLVHQTEDLVRDFADALTDADLPDVYPDCRTVRRSSTQGCALWVRWRRYGW